MNGSTEAKNPAYERELGNHGARIDTLESGVDRIERKVDDFGTKIDNNTKWLIRTSIAGMALIVAIVGLTLKAH